MKKFFTTYSDTLLSLLTLVISICAFLYFYSHGHENLSYYDAIARLNTARKIIDSITPGLGQLGGIWLPFPQVLFIPFIWNSFLWHSGLAGYFVSGTAFVFGAVFIQKAAFLLTKNRKVSLLIWFLYVTNSNLLLLQTMAMSEMFFICFFILTLYYLFLWIQKDSLDDFLFTALCILVLTLTRYEGYFVLLGVTIAIAVACFKKYGLKQKQKIEGMLVLFLAVASFGILLWCMYSALFYKDPLFWLHAYATPQTSILVQNTVVDHFYGITNPNLWESLQVYSLIILWTNGVITVLLALVGFVYYLFTRSRNFLALFIITIVLYLFLVVGYFKGLIPLIEFPLVLLTGTHVREWSVYADNNIRYGIVMLPCLLLFISYLAKKNSILFGIICAFVVGQVLITVANPLFEQYAFYKSWRYPAIAQVPWFRSHYDGGLILIAASRHEDFIFQSGLPYNDFIYEGTRENWKHSLENPSQYATWVIFDEKISGDDVTYGLTKSGVSDLQKHYILVYLKNGFHIYKFHGP